MNSKINTIIILFIMFLALFTLSSATNIKHKKLNEILRSSLENDQDVFETNAEDVFETKPLSNNQINDLVEDLREFTKNEKNCYTNESCARKWLSKMNFVFEKFYERNTFLNYQLDTNMTNHNQNHVQEFPPSKNKFLLLILKQAKIFYKNAGDWDVKVKRMLYLTSQGVALEEEKDVILESTVRNELLRIYGTAKVCDKIKCLSIDPDLSDLMRVSRDYDELLWAWKGWANATGPQMRSFYATKVELGKKAAINSGYNDLSEVWIEEFETENFEETFDELYQEIKPIYEQLHAYTRRKLKAFYGEDKFNKGTNMIPVHLFGNMWAQSWDNIYDILKPYPNVEEPNLDKLMIEKGYTPIKIFKEAEKFFLSIGLSPMTQSFWKHSMIEKPNDREVQCHPMATDFYNAFDFRIKMCTSVNAEDFYKVHHEMGHVEYFMSYKDQPTVFRTGAHSAFHEAIGDTIALSVFTRKHMKQLGFIDDETMSYESSINFLMKNALKEIAILPYGYLIDKWRWDVFRGSITKENYNKYWWKMINKYQGIESPIERTERDFDPGSKFHVPAEVPYARYFISTFLQFQFYEALCKLAGQEAPLHNCDFYGSIKAGHSLKKMLELGRSEHWSVPLELLTNQKTVSSKSILKYFEPLIEWLKTENSKYPNEPVGWSH